MSKPNRYFIKYYYIGSNRIYGSQRQPNLLTVEDILIQALIEKEYIEDVRSSQYEVASRTDKLVSARGAVFSFLTTKEPTLMEMNTALPKKVGVWAYCKVPNDFLSRYNAETRHYKYVYPEPVSLMKKEGNLNLDKLFSACKLLEGRHNFKNFHKRGKKETKTIRDLDEVNFIMEDDYLIFNFKSRAFLRQQIRRMTRKLIQIAKERIEIHDLNLLLESDDYISYKPADPLGLILWDIIYGENVIFKEDPKSKDRMNSFFKQKEKKYGLKRKLFNVLQ